MSDCPIDLNRLSEDAMLALEKTQRDVARIADHFEREWERDKALIAKGEERDAAQRAMNEQALRQNEPLHKMQARWEDERNARKAIEDQATPGLIARICDAWGWFWRKE